MSCIRFSFFGLQLQRGIKRIRDFTLYVTTFAGAACELVQIESIRVRVKVDSRGPNQRQRDGK